MIIDQCECGHKIIKQHEDNIGVWHHISANDLIDQLCNYCGCVEPAPKEVKRNG